MTKRKTVDVDRVRSAVNEILRESVSESKDIRQGAMNVLEYILHSSGNYKGFRFLMQHEVKNGVPGINVEQTPSGATMPHSNYTKRFENTDCTRVEYF